MDFPATIPVDTARLANLCLSGQNRNTIAARTRDLRVFAEFAGADGIPEAAAMLLSRGPGEAHALALEWRDSLVAKGFAPATVNRHLSSLRSLAKLARMIGIVPWTLEIPSVRGQSYRDTSGPGRDAIRRAMEAMVSDPSPGSSRDRAILWLLISPALRATEVCSMNVEDVDLGGSRIRVLRKGRTAPQWITIPRQAGDAIREWIETAGKVEGPLFTALDHHSRGNRLVRQSINRICGRLGLGQPHGLRHSGITTALDETGGDVRSAQRFAGHASPATTMVYDDARVDLAGQVAQKVANAIG